MRRREALAARLPALRQVEAADSAVIRCASPIFTAEKEAACRERQRGMTLIELMVTLTLLGILMTLAVPSFVAFQRNSELTATANSLMATLSAARGEAMKRSLPTRVEPLNNNDWTTGWRAYVDTNSDGIYQAATDPEIAVRREALPASLSISKNGILPSIYFNGSGYALAFSNSTFTISRTDVEPADKLAQSRRVIVAVSGRITVCTPKKEKDDELC